VAASATTALTISIGRPVTYQWWSGGSCAGTLLGTNTKNTTIATSLPPSDPLTMTTAGTVSFKATHDPLAGEDETSPCVPYPVTLRSPTMTVTVPNGTLTAGGSRASTAAMSGGHQASGSLTYGIYSTLAICQAGGTPTTTATVTITTPGTMPASGNMTINRTGATTTSLFWRVAYSGDANNNPSTSACVSKVVNKKATTLLQSVSPFSVTTAQPTFGTATLSGSVLSAGGALTYTAYENTNCNVPFNPNVVSVKTVVSGVAPGSDGLRIPLAGSRYVNVVYAGDDNNLTSTSLCVPVDVTGASPTLNLAVNPPQVNVGGSASGVGTLVGASSTATGTVTYLIYSNATCSSEVSGKSSTATATAGVVSATTSPSSVSFTTSGKFYWRGVYEGDSNNDIATSDCVSFPVRELPSLSVAFSPSTILLGESTVAASSLTGATATAGGTASYATYSDAGCSTPLTSSINGVKTVTNAVIPNSEPVVFSAAGSYYVKSSYSGDTLNAGADSGCAALTVTRATPSISVSVSPDPISAGIPATSSSTITNAYGVPTGTVTCRVFSDSGCTTQVFSSSKSLSSGVVPDSDPFTIATAGTIYANSTYSGDTNNQGAVSACLPVDVVTGVLIASAADLVLPPVEYSNNAQVNAGQITLNVADTRGTGAGWSVTVSAGAFEYSGVVPTQPDIPAANLTLTSAGAPVYISGQPIGAGGPSATSASGTLDVPRTVIAASPGWGSGGYTQPLDVQFTVPGGSAAGTYTAELTITTSTAP
jgi:hypothetical protein